jgi:hypothetical protein
MISAAIRRRQPIPDVVSNAPQLFEGLGTYYDAFTELSTCRTSGMAMGPIPWLAINEYAKRYGYHDDAFDYLVRMIRALDDTFLAYDRDESERKRAEQEIANGPRPDVFCETD